MGKPTGFMEFSRQPHPGRNPLSRIADWRDLYNPLTDDKLKQQASRCMDCAVPFCHTGETIDGSPTGCPVHNFIPEWNDLVYRGQWKEALERLHQTNNFPEWTGRACPAPCEGSCVAALHSSPVAIKSIERSIIDKGFAEGWVVPRKPRASTGKKVAVIGSGPAGLACADQLNQAGHRVTVFERHDRIGGLLTYGIPKMKIEQHVVDRRVDLLRAEGIEFVVNTEIGTDLTVDQLRERFDAIVLCIGATHPRDLTVKGRNSAGVHFAMEFLHRNTKSLLDSGLADQNYISAAGKRVVVIGGGDTATDCVSTAIRHGCKSLTQFDIYAQKPADRAVDNPWPQWPKVHKLDSGQEEVKAVFGDDPRQFALLTKEFISDEQGRLTGVRTVRLIREKGKSGNRSYEEVAGTDKIWPADLVLLAIGFTGPENGLLKQLGVETDDRTNIRATEPDYKTNVEGVFAAGDARRGQSLIVWAIREGRGAAEQCDRYLMTKEGSYARTK